MNRFEIALGKEPEKEPEALVIDAPTNIECTCEVCRLLRENKAVLVATNNQAISPVEFMTVRSGDRITKMTQEELAEMKGLASCADTPGISGTSGTDRRHEPWYRKRKKFPWE